MIFIGKSVSFIKTFLTLSYTYSKSIQKLANTIDADNFRNVIDKFLILNILQQMLFEHFKAASNIWILNMSFKTSKKKQRKEVATIFSNAYCNRIF